MVRLRFGHLLCFLCWLLTLVSGKWNLIYPVNDLGQTAGRYFVNELVGVDDVSHDGSSSFPFRTMDYVRRNGME